MSKHFLSVAITFALFSLAQLGCGTIDQWEPAIDHLTPTDTVDTNASRTPCNGHSALCDKKYNEVAYPATNRSYRYNFGVTQWQAPNQDFPVSRQLRDGIRAISLDVEEKDGKLQVYFGISGLEGIFGIETLSKPLGEIATFLADSSREVVTLFIHTSVSATALMTDLDAAGLVDYMHVQQPSDDWPTLQQMIDSNKRLVVFVDDQNTANAADELLYTWQWVAATPFEVLSSSEFSCATDRGNDGNDLYFLEHHISASIFGFSLQSANKDSASAVNQLSRMYPRAQGCKDAHQHQVNFISVDYYQSGDLLQTINILNGIEESPL
ncbi:MAG: hypothetical protein H6581_19630 [Bacteroidia bacterium]|nr:hypothetical protein [Bacteroidia bacterium]